MSHPLMLHFKNRFLFNELAQVLNTLKSDENLSPILFIYLETFWNIEIININIFFLVTFHVEFHIL